MPYGPEYVEYNVHIDHCDPLCSSVRLHQGGDGAHTIEGVWEMYPPGTVAKIPPLPLVSPRLLRVSLLVSDPPASLNDSFWQGYNTVIDVSVREGGSELCVYRVLRRKYYYVKSVSRPKDDSFGGVTCLDDVKFCIRVVARL